MSQKTLKYMTIYQIFVNVNLAKNISVKMVVQKKIFRHNSC